MANYGPLFNWGWGISGFDARNSTYSGTVRAGPNGSGQFLTVKMSTSVDLTVNLTTAVAERIIGILQNKPSTGIAADVGFAGISKAVAGATIVPADQLMTSSTAPGTLIPFTTAVGTYPCAVALNAATVGAVFDAFLYGPGGGAPGGV